MAGQSSLPTAPRQADVPSVALPMTRLRHLFAAAVLTACPAPALHAQPVRGEVRQIVTFLFTPGGGDQVLPIYRDQLRPIYADVGPLRRLRVYREVESSEPLDLIVVSHYSSMAGMDSANSALRGTHRSGASAFALYGAISRHTQTHHDQFVEMVPELSDSLPASGVLTVFEYIRLSPGSATRFEQQLRRHVRPRERASGASLGSETGRLLVSDGWDYLRVHAVSSLGSWQRLLHARQLRHDGSDPVAARKVIIVRADSTMSVR
jgi:hypothetical protein